MTAISISTRLVLASLCIWALGCRSGPEPKFGAHPVRADACAPVDSGRHLLEYVRTLVAATDTLPRGHDATRRQYELPRVDPATVVLVTDPETCSRAADAYTHATQAHPPWEYPERTRRMHVVRAGDRYVVEDPFTPARAGEFEVWAVFTKDWKLVTRVLS